MMVFNLIVIGFVAPDVGDDGDDDVGLGGRDLLLREGGGRPSRREEVLQGGGGGPSCRWNQLSSRRLVTNPRASPRLKVKKSITKIKGKDFVYIIQTSTSKMCIFMGIFLDA